MKGGGKDGQPCGHASSLMKMCNVIKSSKLVKHVINCSNNKYPLDVITADVSSERNVDVVAAHITNRDIVGKFIVFNNALF